MGESTVSIGSVQTYLASSASFGSENLENRLLDRFRYCGRKGLFTQPATRHRDRPSPGEISSLEEEFEQKFGERRLAHWYL